MATASEDAVTTRAIPTKVDRLIDEAEIANDATLVRALRVYRRLSKSRKRAVLQEILDTRASELMLAYPSIRSIGAGFRRVSVAGSMRETKEPCIVFIVTRKWKKPPKSAAAKRKTLPSSLLTYITDGKGDRRLCAVPTDVDQSGPLARPQSPWKQIGVRTPADPPIASTESRGVVSCAIRITGADDANGLKALSCHHVLCRSIAGGREGRVAVDPEAWLRRDDVRVGDLDGACVGTLRRPESGYSLDLAMAAVETTMQRAALHAATIDLDASDTLEPDEPLPYFARMLTDQHGALRLGAPHDLRPCQEIGYFSGSERRQPRHDRLVRWTVVEGATAPGDSGSPIVNATGTTLLGLHLAGRYDRRLRTHVCYMLPIHYAFNPLNFDLPATARLRLTSP